MSSDPNKETHGGYYTGDIHNQFVEEHYDPKNRRVIWRTFWILLAITIGEVALAFTSVPHMIQKWTFIILTIVKAYFIVGYFMHLKHEKPALGYTIVLPFLLILYLIIMVIIEGNYLNFWDRIPFI